MQRTELVRPVWELLEHQRAERADAPAFRDQRVSRTWSELADRTANLAGHLVNDGVQGSTVCIVARNCVEVVESYLAVVRAGATAVCLNAGAGQGELDYMIADSGATTIITEAALVDAVRAGFTGAPPSVILTDGPDDDALDQRSFERLATTEPPAPPHDATTLDDPAFMLYTSGTTGRPKGVLLSQRSCLWTVAACLAPALELTVDDDILSPLPLFHSYALVVSVLTPLAVGCSELVLASFSPTEVIETLRNEPVTLMPGVPTMFDYVVRSLDGEPLAAKALRATMSAGAILPGALGESFEAVAGVPVLDGYGITETSTMVTMNHLSGARPFGSCGLPVPGCAVRLIDSETGEDVAPDAEGELIVRGPQTMLGYHNQPEATAEVLRNGWYHSGDLAVADPNGYLTITGRRKELIIRGGENIYPAEVEAVLVEHPSIIDAALVGEAHDQLGEVAIAYIVAEDKEAFDREAVVEWLGQHLAPWKAPERFEFADAIPRTGSGKIKRRLLVDPDS